MNNIRLPSMIGILNPHDYKYLPNLHFFLFFSENNITNQSVRDTTISDLNNLDTHLFTILYRK
jgi:hypothetical protein